MNDTTAPLLPDSSRQLVPAHLPGGALPVSDTSGGHVPNRVRQTPNGGRNWPRIATAIVVIAGGALGGAYWWSHRLPPLPAGIVMGNGRIEADPIDISTKFAGRVLELKVDEGDKVVAGQVLALMDTRDLATSLQKSESQAEQAKRTISEARANADQQHSQVVLAEQQLQRSSTLLKDGWVTKEVFDQRQQALEGAKSGELAARERVTQAERALDAAEHQSDLYRVNIADNTLVAPRDGRIAYRIANTGEVLSAGGKVFTMLDTGYVYMDIYLPTLSAGQVKIGDEARIVLDAYPDHPIPASVTFLADQAQFTPKMVETQTERDKLMFRVRVRIDPARSKAHADYVRSGLPGAGYVRIDPKAAWPDRLQAKS